MSWLTGWSNSGLTKVCILLCQKATGEWWFWLQTVWWWWTSYRPQLVADSTSTALQIQSCFISHVNRICSENVWECVVLLQALGAFETIDAELESGPFTLWSLRTQFRRFRPSAVSSEFTSAVRSSGSEVCPFTTAVIRQGFEVLRVSLLSRLHMPEVSSMLKVTSISIKTRWTLALLSTFDARAWDTARFFSVRSALSSVCLYFWRWYLKVHLLQFQQN